MLKVGGLDDRKLKRQFRDRKVLWVLDPFSPYTLGVKYTLFLFLASLIHRFGSGVLLSCRFTPLEGRVL